MKLRLTLLLISETNPQKIWPYPHNIFSYGGQGGGLEIFRPLRARIPQPQIFLSNSAPPPGPLEKSCMRLCLQLIFRYLTVSISQIICKSNLHRNNSIEYPFEYKELFLEKGFISRRLSLRIEIE